MRRATNRMIRQQARSFDFTGIADGSEHYRYLGCYADSDGSDRDLAGRDLMLSGLTVNTCASQCRSSGYPYAGLRLAQRCLCGNSYGNLGPSLGNHAAGILLPFCLLDEDSCQWNRYFEECAWYIYGRSISVDLELLFDFSGRPSTVLFLSQANRKRI